MNANPFLPDPARKQEELLHEVRTRAENIAIGMGGVEYLDLMSKTIGASYADKELPPEFAVMNPHGRLIRLRTRVWTPRGERRNISRNALRQRFPHAYNACVKTSPPDHPYHVRLDAPGREKSQHWAGLKAAGAASWEMALRDRFGTGEWETVQALRHLYDLRADRKRLEESVDQQKRELILFITDNELPLTTKVTTDGQVVLRENAPKVSVNYDLLELRYPAAAALITRTPLSETPRLVIQEIKDDDPGERELDEDDYADSFSL